jgi:hypothetical protein
MSKSQKEIPIKNKPCKFFIQGKCKFSAEECKFSHHRVDTNIVPSTPVRQGPLDLTRIVADKFQYKPKEERKKHDFSDEYDDRSLSKNNKDTNIRTKNTETFEPNYNPADMRVIVDLSIGKNKISQSLQSKDVVVVPDLFCKEEDLSIHQKLLEEMETCGVESDKLWKLWHGDTHMIADDSTRFKERCPTFMRILDKISKYFDMDIKATRFNLYRDDKDWKPYHFDASAIKPEKSKIQNITVGVSFGRTRDIAFEDALEGKGHRRIISLPMSNGYTYAFCKDINVNWRHGVPPIPQDKQTNQSRISIIAWGWSNQIHV